MSTRKVFLFLFVFGTAVSVFFYREWMPDLAWLRITEVVVVVEAPLTESEIRGALPRLEGQNLLVLDGDDLMKRILQNPWVLAASVKKEFPNRIVLSAQVKKPVATRRDSKKLIYLDENGSEIDRWIATRGVDVDLPVISFDAKDTAALWSSKTLVGIVLSLQKAIAPKHRISEIVASDPPFFKVYLVSPPMESLFSLMTWESQIPFFVDLLNRPPRQISQAYKINLVFPKKAVVSFPH